MTENPTLQTLTYEKRNRVAVITLNRPEVLNALNRQMLTELAKVFDQASLDGDIASLRC
jgi:enoyl-CoA hydratase/carnithine racemase